MALEQAEIDAFVDGFVAGNTEEAFRLSGNPADRPTQGSGRYFFDIYNSDAAVFVAPTAETPRTALDPETGALKYGFTEFVGGTMVALAEQAGTGEEVTEEDVIAVTKGALTKIVDAAKQRRAEEDEMEDDGGAVNALFANVRVDPDALFTDA